MADTIQRSYLRNSYGPRVVSAGSGHDKPRSNGSRRHKEGDERDKHDRTKRDDNHRPPNKEHHHGRRTSEPDPVNASAEPLSFELHVVAQPPAGIPLGMSVETSAIVSLQLPSADRVISASNVDTSHLFAVTSLVTDNRNGERVPLEAGSLTGQKVYDSVHPIPEECAAGVAARNGPFRINLGYFSFPGLLIRQAGTYRVRTTLVKMDVSGADTLLAVDSEPIKVERRGTASGRRHQRMYC